MVDSVFLSILNSANTHPEQYDRFWSLANPKSHLILPADLVVRISECPRLKNRGAVQFNTSEHQLLVKYKFGESRFNA